MQKQPITRHSLVGLQPVKEMEELIVGPISARPAMGRCRFSERLLFHGKCCLQVHLSCFHGFVTEPQSDDGAINTLLKKIHSNGVAPMSLKT
jgi:hypothetical protein